MNIGSRPIAQQYTKQLKQRKCRGCAKEFQPIRSGQVVCGLQCAKVVAENKRKVKEKKDALIVKRETKERLKSRGDWAREAQASFNAYIRARDNKEGYGCISCGTKQGKENAGHFRSVGSCPELRFDERNVHLQCERCNTHLHGNILEYRIRLVQRIGQLNVDWLEGQHEPKKYTIDDLKAIKALYKSKLKALEK